MVLIILLEIGVIVHWRSLFYLSGHLKVPIALILSMNSVPNVVNKFLAVHRELLIEIAFIQLIILEQIFIILLFLLLLLSLVDASRTSLLLHFQIALMSKLAYSLHILFLYYKNEYNYIFV